MCWKCPGFGSVEKEEQLQKSDIFGFGVEEYEKILILSKKIWFSPCKFMKFRLEYIS